MTAVLLALLVAQPAPDETARVVHHLMVQFAEVNRLMEEDPEGAIRLVNTLLDDPKARALERSSTIVANYREHALFLRARLQLRQGQARSVADDMTALLDRKRVLFLTRIVALVGQASPLPHAPLGVALCFPPGTRLDRVDCYSALQLRALAYKELGQPDREQADRAEAQQVLSEMTRGLPRIPYQPPAEPFTPTQGHAPSLVALLSNPPFVAGALMVMVPVFFLLGLRQRREAGGTWRRLVWVSLALAALQAIPVLAACLLLRWRPELASLSALPHVTLLVFVANIFRHGAYLNAVRWVGAKTAPPLLEDPAVLGRITEIARRMGISPPVTRLVRSPTALQQTTALISGLAAPTMVLFDGILNRLTEDERDAIIAHELAHQANHTFWFWLVAGAACGVAAVAASAFSSAFVALALGLALLAGTWVILSRLLELDCDRRAARAIGHRRAASALWKIHADQSARGLVEFLIGAVSTHPSRDERLAAIRADAPPDDLPEVEWDSRRLRQRRLAARVAGGLWLSVVAACLLWGYRSPGSNWPALPLVLLILAPLVLFWLGQAPALRRQRRLQRNRWRRLRQLAWLVPVLLAGFLAAEKFGLTEPYLGRVTSLAILTGGGLAWLVLALLLSSRKADRLNQRIVIAIQSGDYPRALALAERNPAAVARNTVLRYNYALIRMVLGRRQEALLDLERLRRDDPGFKMTWLLLGNVYTDEGDYPRALELAAELSRDLPGDPVGPLAESWVLCKLGRLEEAEARAREVLKMDPRAGEPHFTLAAVAFQRGDHAAAREQLAQAERLMPGSVGGALLAAEMALATEDASAEAAVRRAVTAAGNNPLSFRERTVAGLVQRLEARLRDGREAPAVSQP
jgi:Zn-dependent protease with chaperone function/tetratricopeptide (TPR) repeat protein